MKRIVPLLLVLLVRAFAQDPALKDLDGYFPFAVPATREQWEVRAAELRQRILVSQGLFPLPTKTPLNAVIHGRIEQDDYTVEKVFFEAMPGFYVTGNLYRPRNKPGPYPVVLCPHGHWQDARFAIRGDEEMKKEIATGGERLPESGRSIFQSLCVGLARMGCAAFMYDMMGNSDSQQISAALAHGFKKQRPEASAPDGWGFFSAQAELRLQSIMGLQTWSSIRAIDFLTTLPDIDPARIGMTGASGGGTQTFIAAAIDPRIAVAIPCVMVSTAMQGGCTCENASLLRIGTGNVEIAALFAPKPLGMTAANDWTKDMETKGYPELKQLYKMMGKEDNVELWPALQFGHNYNSPARHHIYTFLNKHFALGNLEPITERDYKLLPREQLTVWDATHPAPEGGLEFEKKLLKWWDEDSKKQLAANPEAIREGWRTIIGTGPGGHPGEGGEGVASIGTTDRCIISLSDDGGGIDSSPDSHPGPRLLMPTLIGQSRLAPIPQQPIVKNPREALSYTLGYNHSLFARRVHEVLAIVAAQKKGTKVIILGNGSTAPIAAAAAALAGGAITGVAVELGELGSFAKIADWRDPALLPGALKYGDIQAILRLANPYRVIPFKDDAARTKAITTLLAPAP